MNRFATVVALLALAACTQSDRPGIGVEGLAVEAQGAHPQAESTTFATDRTQRIAKNGSFASLPDRGELLAYPDRDSARHEGAYTWHRAGVSEAYALRAIAEGNLRVVTPSGETLDIQYDHHVEHDSGDWSWVGHLPGDPGAQTILTFGTQAVYGSIAQAGKRSLRLTSRDGAAWLVETDPTKLAGIASEGANPTKPDHLAVPKQLLSVNARTASAERQASSVVAAALAAPVTIDVLVGYSGGIASRPGGSSAALTRINNLVAVTNEAYANSQVNARVRLVHAMQVNYTDTTTNESTLEQLTGYDVSEQEVTPPNAAFNALRAAREQYGADLVVLLRAFRDPEQDGCGIAWLIGGGKDAARVGEQDYFGYSVVGDGQDRNEDDGLNYFCRDESFAHELGHNMGSAHDRAEAMGGDGALDDPDDYGAFAYSFGYKTGTTAGNFYTIMAYGSEGQQDYRVFSSPRITLCGGRACGTANDDNARSLGNLASTIASFRGTVVEEEQPRPIGVVAGNFNGDGKYDIFWRHGANGNNVIWRSASSGLQTAVTGVADVRWQAVATGDFNGDGRSDLLWRHAANGRNTIWLSGNAATQRAVTSVTDLAWQVAGAGDFNRDGRSDILWRNSSTGANAIWLSGNVGTQQTVASVADTRWQIVGTGDFNADGRSDIVWRHSTNGRNTIWLSGNGNTQQAMITVVDPTWRVVGVGDFDGNGRDDLVWRHDGSGRNAIWLAGNGNTQRSIDPVADPAWKVASVGDFNGDGRSDILWRHASSGRNTIWRSAYSTAQQTVTTVADVFWAVVG